MATSAAASGTEPRSIAILSSDPEASSALELELSSLARLNWVKDIDSLHLLLDSSTPQLLLVDLDSVSADRQELEAFAHGTHQRYPHVPVIALTRSRSVARAVRQFGFHAALIAPVDPDRLVEEVSGVLTGHTAAAALVPAGRRSLGHLIGVSESMQSVYDSILRLAESNTTVLIRGESGSGKELAARAIVSLGRRASKPFIRPELRGPAGNADRNRAFWT